jgi:lipid-binding SYLF domain-containing protein
LNRWNDPASSHRRKINANVHATLEQFFRKTPGSRALAGGAAGVLVFPTVVKAGIGIGGEYSQKPKYAVSEC